MRLRASRACSCWLRSHHPEKDIDRRHKRQSSRAHMSKRQRQKTHRIGGGQDPPGWLARSGSDRKHTRHLPLLHVKTKSASFPAKTRTKKLFLNTVARDHFFPLPCSDLGQGVAISTTAFMLPRFFVQTPIFSVSPSSFSLQQI